MSITDVKYSDWWEEDEATFVLPVIYQTAQSLALFLRITSWVAIVSMVLWLLDKLYRKVISYFVNFPDKDVTLSNELSKRFFLLILLIVIEVCCTSYFLMKKTYITGLQKDMYLVSLDFILKWSHSWLSKVHSKICFHRKIKDTLFFHK